MPKYDQAVTDEIEKLFTFIVSETNGISLNDTLDLLLHSDHLIQNKKCQKLVLEFKRLVNAFHTDEIEISTLLNHQVADAIFQFFRKFPLPYYEEHIHLTGSLTAEFIYPRLMKLLKGPNKKIYEKKIKDIYGLEKVEINSVEDVNQLIRLKDGELFDTYLKILTLSKLILNSKKVHTEASYHMAKELYEKYNVGNIRLKFTLSRSSTDEEEQVPGTDKITSTDVVMGLYDGFMKYRKENPLFNFVLSPCFRKEESFYDSKNFKTKKEHFHQQVQDIVNMIDNHPELKNHLLEVDTVGDERELYRKKHFLELKSGLRKLQYKGLKLRSHHGETWKILKTGIQSVDNAMNIWHIDTLEHGISLGINPNYYFHRLLQKVLIKNSEGIKIDKKSKEYFELMDMTWYDVKVRDNLINGVVLKKDEIDQFLKTKFHTAREIEHYQHDVLNRVINKGVSLVALPSSNLKLTGSFTDFKDHPFSWWEKKGVNLSIGTDNYITLDTNFIQELMILLFSDPDDLKITKLLMLASKETRRPYISHLLWDMRKRAIE
jgi:adenosine deaminase